MTITQTRRVTATELSRNLSALLGEVRHLQIDLEVTKGEEIIARVLPPATVPVGCPVDRLDDVFRRLPVLDPDEADAFVAEVRAGRDALVGTESTWDS